MMHCSYFQVAICMVASVSGKPAEGLTPVSFLMGPGSGYELKQMSFRPEDGLRFREIFQEKHGVRGEMLIARFGQGLAIGGPTILDPDHAIVKLQEERNVQYRTKVSPAKRRL